MSAREWMPGKFVGSRLTGDGEIGAGVFEDPLKRGYHLSAHFQGRVYAEGPLDLDEAKALASQWLDRREAEAKAREPLCMSCASFHGDVTTPGYCSHHSDQREPTDSCAAWRRTDDGAQKGGTT